MTALCISRTTMQALPLRFLTRSQSQPMSQFSDNINSRLVVLGVDVKAVHADLNRRGFDVAYSTVAGWFNGNRGMRWKVDELYALLDVLQTDLAAMAGAEAELVEEPIPAAIAREARGLTPAMQQAILAMIRSSKDSSNS
jgi:hypothetical protein